MSHVTEVGLPTPCTCSTDRSAAPTAGPGIPWGRLEAASEITSARVSAKLGGADRLAEEKKVHIFADGFGVGDWTATPERLTFSAAGVVRKVPAEATLSFDLSFFNGPQSGEHPDVLWVELELHNPVKRQFKTPLRGIGVLRDPGSGALLRCDSFELATDLMGDVDVGDIAKAIACVLACVGLFCAAVCAPLCVAVIACVVCLGTCVGANVPQFLACVAACGIAVDGLEEALT